MFQAADEDIILGLKGHPCDDKVGALTTPLQAWGMRGVGSSSGIPEGGKAIPTAESTSTPFPTGMEASQRVLKEGTKATHIFRSPLVGGLDGGI